MNLEDINNQDVSALLELLLPYAIKFTSALAVFIIGYFIVKLINKLVLRAFKRTNFDDALENFIASTIKTTLNILLFITVISTLGVEMTSFVALLGGAGVAVGMALSGTLQNFAGGVMILLFKPFRAGDFIEAQGYMGTVKEIQIFHTVLTTPDNKTIIIPNSPLATDSLINYSAQTTRRVDMTFGIAYEDDIDQARSILKELVDADQKILKDPETQIVIGELADSSVNFFVRAWVNSSDYWDVHFDMMEKVKKAFDQKGISIPYPQQDVHLKQVNS